MKMYLKGAFATGMLAAALCANPSAQAATLEKHSSMAGAGACQLSIPTIDTKVRPRATGFRNEGTSNAFVVCSFLNVRTGNVPTQLMAHLFSFDSAEHTFDCTFVGTLSFGAPIYLTKSVTTLADNSQASVSVATADNVIQRYNTMTCILPPGVSINGVQAVFQDEIGG